MRASFSSTAYSPDQLLVGGEYLSRQITLVSGQNLPRGAVLGRITASGKYTLSASAAGDGSQTPDCILAEATNASAGDVVTIAFFRGSFNANKVVLGTGHTVGSVTEGLRVKDIHLVPAQAAV
jgi:hypothetical protein